MRRAVLPVLALSLTLFGALAFFAAADTGAPCANPHTATSEDIAAGYPAGSQVCPKDEQGSVSVDSGRAKQDLAQLRCSSGVNTDKLDAKFSICADKFIRQLRQSDPSACVNSAYRSVSDQVAACRGICGALSCPGLCAPPGRSRHQYGLAIDLRTSMNLNQLWQTAMQFGLQNPKGLHGSDPKHIQNIGGLDCSSGNVQPSDDDLYIVAPDNSAPYYCITSIDPVIVVPSNTPPGAGCYNKQQLSPFTQPMMPMQPTLPSQPSQSTPTQPIQYQQTGNSLQNSLLNGGSLNLASSTASTTPAASDLLNALNAPTGTTATSSPISLNLGDLAQVQPSQTPTQRVPVQTGGGRPEYVAQQTFTTTDLSGAPGAIASQTTINSSPLQQILAGVRNILVSLLNYVQRL